MSFTREETVKYHARSTFFGVTLFLFDLAMLAGCVGLALYFQAWWLQVIFSLLAANTIAALFVVGHDAAHDALTPHRRLNRIIGTIAFLPSMHPYSLWVKLHNLRHHHWTNLFPKDDVWTPYDLASYRALPWHRRLLYQFYRSPYGPVLYYLIDFWWEKFTWPTSKHYGSIKRQYVIDTILVWGFAAVYLSLLVYGAGAGWFGGVERPWWNPVLFGALLPFFVWNIYSGASIYLHHTHPAIVWYNDEAEWRRVSKADTAIHVVFPRTVQILFHFIMEHSAHHLRPGVPLYHLKEAQECLEEKDDNHIIVYHWSLARHVNICRRCKLYDFDAKRWMDFEGNYTSSPPRRRGVSASASTDEVGAEAQATAG